MTRVVANSNHNSGPGVSIILPVCNQSDHIGQALGGYGKWMEHFDGDVEFLLVVNGSTDASIDICRGIAERDQRFIVIEQSQAGWGRAVRTGFDASRGRVICYTNTARTSPHTLLTFLVMGMERPAYLHKANRRLRYPITRRLGSVLYNIECRSLFELASWDINGTPKIIGREHFERLALVEDGDLLDLEVIVKCEQLGIQTIDLPVVSTQRFGGKSTTGFRSALRLYAGAFRRSRDRSWFVKD